MKISPKKILEALEEHKTASLAAKSLGLSSTQFRQKHLNALNKCINCLSELDKKGLICSVCLKKSRDKVKENLPKSKICFQCQLTIVRKDEQNNISWAKQKICDSCEHKNSLACHKIIYERDKFEILEESRNNQQKKEYQKEYRNSPTGKLKKQISNAKRRALKSSTSEEGISDYIERLFSMTKNCTYCDKESKLTIDHMLPLNKGGTHTKENISLCCSSCNSKKGTMNLEEYFDYLEKEKQFLLKKDK